MIVIFDFGSQYSHLIARRIRGIKFTLNLTEFNVYCELISCLVDISVIKAKQNIKVGFPIFN